MPPKKNMMPMQKPSNVRDTMKRIFSYMYGFKLHFLIRCHRSSFSALCRNCRKCLLKPLIDNLERGA